MNSTQRREARYLRRVAARRKRKAERLKELCDFDKVFTYAHLYESYRKSRRNVAWKASVQRYMIQAPQRVLAAYNRLRDGTWRSGKFTEFDIVERGKLRHIRSVGISERVVQRCLCDHCLVPALSRTFIYDNGASLKDRGYHFASRRLTQHLREHYRKHGCEGYVLIFDFSGYFDSIPHDLALDAIAHEIDDKRLLALCKTLVAGFGKRGLGLGSQISQVLALAAASRIDHYVKEVLRIRGYGRYMDDGYLIHRSKAYLRECLGSIRMLCTRLGLRINERKTQVVKLTHGFSWLKVRYRLMPSGRVLRRIRRDATSRKRRKLKAIRKLCDAGRMTEGDAWLSYQSWRAYAYSFDSHRSVVATDKTFMRLFPSVAGNLRGGMTATAHVHRHTRRADACSARSI